MLLLFSEDPLKQFFRLDYIFVRKIHSVSDTNGSIIRVPSVMEKPGKKTFLESHGKFVKNWKS